MKRIACIHPLLFAVFPVLYLFAINIDELYTSAFQFLPFILLLVVTLAVGIFLFFLLFTRKDVSRASIMTTVVLFAFFSYGYLFDSLNGLIGSGVIRHRYVFPVIVLSTFCFVLYIGYTKKRFEKLHSFLNVMGGIFLLISILTIFSFLLSNNQNNDAEAFFNLPEDSFTQQISATYRPDIYYIVLDAYANNDVLTEFYGYDNSTFGNFLENRGFSLAEESMSNYGYTYASLSSSLNMNYINSTAEAYGIETDSVQPLSYLIENNEVIEVVKKFEYDYIHFSSGYPMTNFNRHADVSYRQGMDRFTLFLLNSTLLRPVTDPTSSWRLGFSKTAELQKRILFELDTLQEMPSLKQGQSPKFVFVHIVSPHQPYIFDAEGNPIDERSELDPEGYTDQITFINNRMMEIVDTIQSESTEPPIIIIQSDHGVNPPTSGLEHAKFHNFTAINFGSFSDTVLQKNITPVNIFRIVFNTVFEMQLPLLEEKVFATTEESRLEFVDVTHIVTKQRQNEFKE